MHILASCPDKIAVYFGDVIFPKMKILPPRFKRLNSHRTLNNTGEVLQIYQTDPSPPTHKLLQHKYWRLRQEGSGDTVDPSDDTPGQGQTGRI